MVTPSVHRSESADSATCTCFCLTPALDRRFHGNRLGWSFSGDHRDDESRLCPDSSPCIGGRLLRRQQKPLRFESLLYCTAHHGWRCPPPCHGLLHSRRSPGRGIPPPSSESARFPAAGKAVFTGVQKMSNKGRNELLQTTLPAFAIPFMDFRDILPVGRCGQKQTSDIC